MQQMALVKVCARDRMDFFVYLYQDAADEAGEDQEITTKMK